MFRWRSNSISRSSDEATALCAELDRRAEQATRDRLAHLAGLVLNTEPDWQQHAEADFAFIQQITAVRAAMRRARAGSATSSLLETVLRFQVSTLFLDECHRYLTSDPAQRERMHLVTGIITPDGVRVMSRIEKVTYAQQTNAYVMADPTATHKQLIALTESHGHDLLAMYHSHPTHGLESTQPSATDIANQDRFAAIGWDAIGGIFSLDGYVRFFSTCKDFTVGLYGNGADIISVGPRETIAKIHAAS